jgi:hydroxymethylbilane synthase
VIALDGSRQVRTRAVGSVANPSTLGVQVAEALLARGADTILADALRVSSDTSEQP